MTNIRQAQASDIYSLYQQQNPDRVFIDVRRPDEWAEGTITGARKIVLDDLPGHLDALDRAKTYVLVCRSGGRSGKASQLMEEAGFDKLINFDGGMLAWQAAGYPLELGQP